MKLLILCIAMQIACYVGAYAQTAELNLISTAGGYFETSTVSMSWSIGEVLTEPFSTNNLYLGQGFQKGGDFTTSVSQINADDFNIELYPNPASNEFKINLQGLKNQNLNYQLQLFDISGQLVKSEELLNTINTIDINMLKSGTYFVRLIDINKTVKKIFILEKVNY